MMVTNRKYLLLACLLATGAGGTAYAQDGGPNAGATDGNLDLTMTLMPANATLPDAVTKIIELPAQVTTEAAARAEEGLERANEARENREAGLDTAEQAREGGREFGEQMRALAQENRENAGRGEPPATPPPVPVPGPPDVPGPPQN